MLQQIKCRPILFSGQMIRALLDGIKTQTRRIVKPPSSKTMICDMAKAWSDGAADSQYLHVPARHKDDSPDDCISMRVSCPYGAISRKLWVRETWQGPLFDDMDAYRAEPADFNKPEFCQYAADGGPAPEFMTIDDELVCRWRPSIHMPRWASRITLEITSVRVERLQDISEADAIAEGVEPWGQSGRHGQKWNCPPHVRRFGAGDNVEDVGFDGCPVKDPREAYRGIWAAINGPGSWEANPFVWAISFKRIGEMIREN